MLRGKFGQIGKDLGDGHITMDAFQQAAFRDHIRSGERIMFLASMGRLKHKRTRDTIAAEPTPRSSCPSEADPKAAPTADPEIPNSTGKKQTSGKNIEKEADLKGASAPVPHAGTRGVASAGRASDWLDNPGAKDVDSGNAVGDRKGFRTPAWSPPRPVSPTAKHHNKGAESHPRHRRIANGDDNLLPGKGPTAGNLGARAASSGELGFPSPRARQQGRDRPRSACAGGHRSRSPGVVTLSYGNPDTSTKWAETAGDVPLQVGPTITTPPAKGVGCRGITSPSALQPPRPASARVLEQGARARNARQGVNSSPAIVARRGIDSHGRGRGSERPSGDCGASPVRSFDEKDVPARRDTVNACYSTERGSFAASVLNSARALKEYDVRPKGDDCFTVPTMGNQRPKSANAAAATAINAAAGAKFPTAEEVAAETRLMPVGAIHRAFKGRRLAAVQAWDPLAAAAVRADRAEKMLRRALLGRTGTNSGETMPAAAPARRRPRKGSGPKAAATTKTENKVGGGASDRGGGGGSRKCSSAPRVRGPDERAVGRGGGEGDGGSDADWCGSRGMRRDVRRELSRTELARAVAAVERIGGRRIVHDAGAPSPNPNPKPAVGGTAPSANVLNARNRDAVESPPCPSRESIKTSKSRSASGFSRETSATSRTPRTSTATSRSSRCPSSRRGSSTCKSGRGTSMSCDEPVEMRRARLLAELEVLRRRMHDAEGLLREVDRSRPKQRPQTATHGPRKKLMERRSTGGRASTVATAGNTSAKSSAGYGAFNLGERATAPRVVTHPANAFLDRS